MAISFLEPWWLLLLVPVISIIVWAFHRAHRTKSGKEKAVTILRCVIVLLLVLSLSGVSLRKYSDETAVVFVADLSDSTSDAQEDMTNFIRAALGSKPQNYQTGIVTFGKQALVEQPVGRDMYFNVLETMPASYFTNIGEGLQMASAVMPGETRKRVVLLTDGSQNLGDGLERARALAEQGIRIDGVFLNTQPVEEVQITSLELPGYLYQGETYDINVRLDSTVNTSGILRLYANRQMISEQQVEIQKGENRFIFKDTAEESGIKTYEVDLQVEKDSILRNNRMASYIHVKGVPSVAVVEGQEGESREMEKILGEAGIQIKHYTPHTLPANLEELRKYQGLILNNVSADDLGDDKINIIDSYVKNLGRGLLVTGGDSSYALGGYMGTAFEKMLPVDMDLTQKADLPSLGLVVVIDKSGSMMEGRYGITKLELAKEAAVRSTEALRPTDSIGVITFDDAASWVVETQKLDDLKQIQDDIGTIRPGGGTNMYPGLKLAFDSLREANTQLKHIIVLTDGMSAPGDFEGLAADMGDYGITLSTVAVGEGSDTALLENLAEIGKGRYYFTDEFNNIPKIFTKETYLATQSYVQNRTFFPAVTGYSPIISGFDQGFPALHGYIATTPKSTASIPLSSDKSDPLMAEWQYGLGRVVAWASDLRGIWTQDWLTWDRAGEFWLNTVSRLLPSEDEEGAAIETARNGDQGQVTVTMGDMLDETLNSRAVIVDPEGSEQEIELQVTEPGKYQGYFDIDTPGVYLVRVEQQKGGEVIGALDTGLAVPYSPEYDIRQKSSQDLLKRLVEQTGGRLLDKPEQVFSNDLEPVWAQTEIWPFLLPLALILFAIDIALRRLKVESLWMNLRKKLQGAVDSSREKTMQKNQPMENPATKAKSEASSPEVNKEPPAESKADTQKTTPQRSTQKSGEKTGNKIPEDDKSGFASQLLDARRDKRRKL